jgi:hypothetical protein
MTEFQNFWRCEHHPSALANFFNGPATCEWCCHTQELHWYHGGERPMPKSWSEQGGEIPNMRYSA